MERGGDLGETALLCPLCGTHHGTGVAQTILQPAVAQFIRDHSATCCTLALKTLGYALKSPAKASPAVPAFPC